MAKPNLKAFYIGLVAIAVVGGGAIVYVKQNKTSQVRTAATVDPGADSAALVGYVLGSDSAKLEIEEYADFECGACQQFAVLTMPDVRDRLIRTGQVRWRFHDFPLQQHLKSPFAHEGAACAAEQGKFWEIHDQIYFGQNKWVPARNSQKAIRDYAKAVGVDLGRYDECVDAHRYEARIAASVRQGQARGVNSTPTFIIGKMLIPEVLSYDSLRVIVDNIASGKIKTS